MTHEMIITEVQGRVGIIRHNRPEKLNALHPIMNAERKAQIEEWNEDPSIGAIVVTGEGRAFCSGADVGGWQQNLDARERGQELQARGEYRAPDGSPESWTQFCMRSKPLIAAINGASIGAGLTTILPWDVRIASERATLSMRFIRMGIFPELASTHILPHIVGVTQALELMLTGRIIDGVEAARIGLVNKVVPHEKLMDEALAVAHEIAFNPLEHSMAVKRVTWQNLDEVNIREVHRREREELQRATSSREYKEAVRAFLEKRQPDFHNLS